ncbi:TPA: hypothetical protein ACX96Z_000108 [Clostridium sporogenes]
MMTIAQNEEDEEKFKAVSVCKANPVAKVIISYMDTVNYGFLFREELKNYLVEKGMIDRVLIPAYGQS